MILLDCLSRLLPYLPLPRVKLSPQSSPKYMWVGGVTPMLVLRKPAAILPRQGLVTKRRSE